MVIKWTNLARQDLIDFQFYTLKTDDNTKKYVSSLVNYVDVLADNPQLGKFLFTSRGFDVRQLLYKKHRVIYTIKENTIYIISLVHTSRDINSYLKYLKENLL